MCLKTFEVHTACAHNNLATDHICGSVSFLNRMNPLKSRCSEARIYANLRLGWCKDCAARANSLRIRLGSRPLIDLRDVTTLRRYWEYRSIKRIEGPVSTPMPYEAFDASLGWGNYQDPDDRPETWEELGMLNSLRSVRPEKVWLGPLSFTFPCDPEGVMKMLHLARVWTIIWAKGDNDLYKMAPSSEAYERFSPNDIKGWEYKRAPIRGRPRFDLLE